MSTKVFEALVGCLSTLEATPLFKEVIRITRGVRVVEAIRVIRVPSSVCPQQNTKSKHVLELFGRRT